MHILFVAPYPLSRVRVRSYGFVRELAKHHDVTVLALCSGEQEAEDVRVLQREGIAITAIIEKRHHKVLRALRAAGTGLPLQVAFDASPALRAAIETHLKNERVDLVHVEFIRALGALPDTLAVPVVWDAVDCISQLYEQGARVGATPMVRLIGKGEAQRVRAYEYTQLQRFRQVLVTSERDRQALLDIHKAKSANGAGCADITVMPHGIDTHYFQQYTGERQPETLVFSGKMSFHANVAGALVLAQQVLPLLWKQRPTIRLVIAGSDPPPVIRRLARAGRIEVTGRVSDLRPYIAQAQVAVCPLPYAVGIQNKILEAMAVGTPVVASSHAAAGLQTVAGRDLLVADAPDAFAEAVLRLLDNKAAWQTLAQHGRSYIEQNHDWERIMTKLGEVYDHAIAPAPVAMPTASFRKH